MFSCKFSVFEGRQLKKNISCAHLIMRSPGYTKMHTIVESYYDGINSTVNGIQGYSLLDNFPFYYV